MLPTLETADWYRALPLSERTRAAPESRRQPEGWAPTERAWKRLRRWRGQTPFPTGEWWARRLAQQGLEEPGLLWLLDEPPQAVAAREQRPPGWVEDLEQALAQAVAHPRRLLPDEPGLLKKADGMLYLVEPLLGWARQQADLGIQALARRFPQAPLEPATALRVLYASLPQRLFSLLHRTLLLELQVAGLEGRLEGDTPQARLGSFVRRLREPEVRAGLLREYAVLSRQLMVGARQWLEVGLEFLERLCADWELLRATFGLDGTLVAVHEGGDRHEGGRAVRIAEFSGGQRLVYKPRSLACDLHFQQLVEWLNARGGCLPLRVLEVVDRGGYGWCEFVERRPCDTPEQLERFYERQGCNLALHYVLHSTDVHFENLIAAGEHPLLVDLESLFQSRFAGEEGQESQSLASRLVASSVLRVSLLPQRQWADAAAGYQGIDVSGLEARDGQLTAERLMQWEGEDTDTMRIIRQRVATQGSSNRPTLQGAEVSALEYTEALVRGFTRMYRLLMEQREPLRAEGGPLARFAEDRIRVIARHTLFYSRLLEESTHPDVLRDALERDRLFDRLWYGVDREPYLEQVIASEHEDLWRGDIPVFTSRPGSRDLWDSAGRRLPGFLVEPGLELVHRRLGELSEEDLRRQTWFIRASLGTLASTLHKPPARPHRLLEPEQPPAPEQLLAAARSVADRLESLALHGEEDAAWIGLTLASTVEPLWVDLYDGVPGIALFCAYLGELTGEARYTRLARAAWRNVQRQLESGEPKCTLVGLFSGLGGLLYVLSHLRALWGEPALEAEAAALLERLPALIDADPELDLLGGSAGCILALQVLRRQVPGLGGRALELSVRCGERLLARAQALPAGLGWTNATSALRPLSGLSHGAAGYALALLELAAASGEPRFRQAALSALAYERSTFSPEARNWRDMRDPTLLGRAPGEVFYSMAWCHGAPGIGLSRLRLLEHLDDEAVRAEIAAAVEATSAQGFGMSHSLCHGDLGNVELLLLAGELLGEPGWSRRARLLGGAILQSAQEHGWKCGNPSQVEMPGLMTGLAGIGYGLLRLAEPARVPSVLALEPPRGSSGAGTR